MGPPADANGAADASGTPTQAGHPTEGLPAFFCKTVDKYGFTLINQ
jgi:hypothetical protein